jgi:gliding motility-associated-like protein
MCRRKFLLFFIFITLSFKAFPAVFVVTSNADSGPGTLREALTLAAANGTAALDHINFNLPGTTQAERTITINTQLPDVTANVIIDGSTQPGTAFGVSGAKVIITIATPIRNVNAFNLSNQVGPDDAVEFYGLYIKDFWDNNIGGGSAIAINNSCRLVIGAPGKGNVICGNEYAILGNLNNSIIQSNFLGLQPDGETASVNRELLAAAFDFNNLLIGGDNQADGNIIVSLNDNALSFGAGTGSNNPQHVIIKNNFFGTNYNGTKVIGESYPLSYIYAYVPTIDLEVTANVFCAGNTAIYVMGVGQSTITVKGNYFGTNKSQTVALRNGGQAITTQGFVTTIIGGQTDEEQNIFTGYNNPIMPLSYNGTDVIKNKFYCNDFVELPPSGGNYLRIIKLFDNEVSGDAPPGATVQLYYSTSQCNSCNPNTWFATVTADANGVWDYKGNTAQNVMASSTVGGNTVGFQPYYVSPDQVTVINKDCHHNGSIKMNEKRSGRFIFKWTEINSNYTGSGQEIDDLQPGTYKLEISEGGSCPVAAGTFDIFDTAPHVYPQNFQLDCANPTGTLYANYYTFDGTPAAKYVWTDANGLPISNDEKVTGLPAGKYYLYIIDDKGCNSTTELYEILPAVDVPVIDDSKAVQTDANCDFTDGTVNGISVSNLGNSTYGWRKVDGDVLSYGQMTLGNAQAGEYYFFVQYSINCPELRSRTFTIHAKNAIVIDDSGVKSNPAGCSKSTGSITGIKFIGATKYKWVDGNNKTIGTNPDLTGVPAGDYTVTASNGTCSLTSPVYIIDQQQPTPFPQYAATFTPSCFGDKSGSVTITTDGLVKSVRWINSQGIDAGNNAALAGVAAGAYQLYLTDQNGCETYYNTYTVQELPEFKVAELGQATSDACNIGTGSISSTTFTGGLPPYVYTWYNADKQQIGTGSSISNLKAGTYILNVIDSRCGNADIPYTIGEEMSVVSLPSVSDIQLCSSGSALIMVNNAAANAVYHLYDDASTSIPLSEATGGRFTVTVTGNRSFYVSRMNGTCESPRAEIKVTVGLSVVNIANAFTPNGDGINDYWQISNIENYPSAIVQVFTRYGQKVFESKGYSTPFDGTLNAKKLPAGVYYFIINLKSNCNILSGSLVIIR